MTFPILKSIKKNKNNWKQRKKFLDDKRFKKSFRDTKKRVQHDKYGDR